MRKAVPRMAGLVRLQSDPTSRCGAARKRHDAFTTAIRVNSMFRYLISAIGIIAMGIAGASGWSILSREWTRRSSAWAPRMSS